jgi:hypothetical protein
MSEQHHGERDEAAIIESVEPTPLSSVIRGIDELIASLGTLRAQAVLGELSNRVLTDVAKSYDRHDATVLALVRSASVDDLDESRDDPLPDRLREALLHVVRVCVPEPRRHYIAIQTLGLEADGAPPTLRAIASELDRSTERVRQLRKTAFGRINANLSRRIGSVSRLRAVLHDISPETDWRDPAQVAPWVVRLLSDHFTVAEQITYVFCRAAGAASDDALGVKAAEESRKACEDANIRGEWRFDRWQDVVRKAVFHTVAHFDSPPEDLIGLKRAPESSAGSESNDFTSKRLGRIVACESGTERRVFSWLEKSQEVRWYQEQPARVPYVIDGRRRHYYPDIAVLDESGRLIVVEVKPAFMMYRVETLAKAMAALNHFGERGIGYLLVDAAGRTLADLARKSPFDTPVAEEVESLLTHGPVPFHRVRHVLARRTGRLDFAAFIAMVVSRDWAVTSGPGVQVSRLPAELSFRMLCAQP